ncbi:hypothetical protein BBOV_III001405 [Babesia bovis T2Bo]|uniref:hypothetical protein n=1 Tax=Babesia bovis T2Bo TaxID=484906 RepID=UPI001C36595E|nr:hypothetical protein BBOV_III001405 [Babesia bovis T2Bo]KAG6440070.1 hypothetical protein BBOV_III001405 [Babesia bovis T2Bo]
MKLYSQKKSQEDRELLERRIQHVAEAAVQLANKIPSVSHALMRQALCHINDIDGEINSEQKFLLCPNCGAVRTFGINTTVKCQRSNLQQRRKCRKKCSKQKNKSRALVAINAPVQSHKTVVMYHCNLCKNKAMIPGVQHTIPAKKNRTENNIKEMCPKRKIKL